MNIFQVATRYINQVIIELKKVTYPTLNQVLMRTVLVVVSIGVATAIIGSLDAGVAELLKLFVFKQGA
jgi:preprotein translocase SecE subunit